MYLDRSEAFTAFGQVLHPDLSLSPRHEQPPVRRSSRNEKVTPVLALAGRSSSNSCSGAAKPVKHPVRPAAKPGNAGTAGAASQLPPATSRHRQDTAQVQT